MKQDTRAAYFVEKGEEVTIIVQAIKVGNFATLALDGVQIKPVSTSPLTYKFTVTAGKGQTHFGLFSCHFPDDAPDDAEYQLFISGDEADEEFKGSNVIKTDSGRKLDLSFTRE